MSLFATEGRFFLFGESSVEVVVITFLVLVAVYVFVEWLLSFGICFHLCWFSGSFSNRVLAFGTSSVAQSHSAFEESVLFFIIKN